jgi:hypothetical protein
MRSLAAESHCCSESLAAHKSKGILFDASNHRMLCM